MPTKPTAQTSVAIAHIDGASRSNPGPAAYAVVFEGSDGTPLGSFAKYLGIATNNFAEYQGLLAALDYAIKHHYLKLKVISDSELIVRQTQGRYKVKSPDLKLLHERALRMISELDSFSIEHVRREQNREADRLANEALDRAGGTTSKQSSPVFGAESFPEELDRLAVQVVDAASAVHSRLGPGLLEAVYETSLVYELTKRGLRTERQVDLPLEYDGVRLDAGLRVGLVVEDKLVVEPKAVETILPVHVAPVFTYLKLTGHHLGLLINFNVSDIEDGVMRITR